VVLGRLSHYFFWQAATASEWGIGVVSAVV